MLSRIYDFTLRLPAFKGKPKLQALMRRLLRQPASTITRGLTMELDPEEWLQIELRARGLIEPRTTALFERLLHDGDTCVDVGAHVGYHSLIARDLVGERGRVIAVDPQPYNCARIIGNAELNRFANIVVVAAALGDRDGSVSLRSQSRHDKARLTLAGPGVNDGALTFIVPQLTLSGLFERCGLQSVDLLKVDVEGFELEVLRGGGAAIEKVKNIVFEMLPEANADKSQAIEQMLTGNGFRLFDVEGGPWRAGQSCIENNIWARRA